MSTDSFSKLVLCEFLCLFFGRELLESKFCDYLEFKSPSTPGRIISSIHGIFVLVLFSYQNWKDSVESTFLYFVLDFCFLLKYNFDSSLKFKTMLIHHVLGIILCAYSSFQETYLDSHFGNKITRALLFLEVCNPVLHLSMINRYEFLFSPTTKFCLECLMLFNYFYSRVWCLGLALNESDPSNLLKMNTYPVSLFYACSILLWILQMIWFLYLFLQTILPKFLNKISNDFSAENSNLKTKGDH